MDKDSLHLKIYKKQEWKSVKNVSAFMNLRLMKIKIDALHVDAI